MMVRGNPRVEYCVMSRLLGGIMRFKLVLCMLALFSTVPIADAKDGMQVVKIAAEGGSAVTKDPKGRLGVLHVGDRFSPYGTVMDISDGRIVLASDQGETFLIDMKSGTQSIKRISKVNGETTKKMIVSTITGDIQRNEEGKSVSVHKSKKGIKRPDK
jgi:hypothetical protein